MRYDPSIGIFGNIARVYAQLTQTGRDTFNEVSNRMRADMENREAVEQALTDLYLDGVQAQQDITDIQLQLLGG